MHYLQDSNPQASTADFQAWSLLKVKTGSYLGNNEAAHLLGVHDWPELGLHPSLQHPRYGLTPWRCCGSGTVAPVPASAALAVKLAGGPTLRSTPLLRNAPTRLQTGPLTQCGSKSNTWLGFKAWTSHWSAVPCGTGTGWPSGGTGSDSWSSGALVWCCQAH